ncbi:MAG: protein-L-isoaspartate O-methyltransferase [bacterium]|nr:protein-L-isoaspartate O-methyltransferase [bacterium]
MSNEELINNLILNGYLKTPAIIQAFKKVDRADFVPDNMKNLAYINDPLPIGHGQTISQPLTVAIMFELLNPKPGQKILDIGFGSGWTTAMLANIVHSQPESKGLVVALEIIPEIFEFGKKNIEKYHFKNVELFNQSGYEGLPKEAPPSLLARRSPEGEGESLAEGFDRILVSASTQEVSESLKKQLKIGGKLVIPVRNSIFEIKRKEDDEFEEKEHFGFSFVPFIEN